MCLLIRFAKNARAKRKQLVPISHIWLIRLRAVTMKTLHVARPSINANRKCLKTKSSFSVKCGHNRHHPELLLRLRVKQAQRAKQGRRLSLVA